MKTRLALTTLIGSLALLIPNAQAALPPEVPALPNYDKRTEALPPSTAKASASLGSAQDEAASRLQSLAPEVRISRDRILASPKLISAPRGFLTGPDGHGGTISEASLAAVPSGDSHRVIKAFLNEHAALFGHNADALTSTTVQRDYVTAHNGLRTVVWQQTLDGIEVFEGLLIGHVTRNGELVSLSSHFVSDTVKAADQGTPNRASLAGNPEFSANRAIRLAAANVGAAIDENAVSFTDSSQGSEKRQSATVPGLFGPVWVQLIWLPMNPGSMRLCWRVILGNLQLEHYLVLVDAGTGEVLVRRSLTAHISPATYSVFPNDGPSPFSPGSPTPSGFQPGLVSRTNVTLSALDTNASPQGWIPDAQNVTGGNNAIAFLDRNLDGISDVPLPAGSPNRVFTNFVLDLTQPPLSYASASTVQLFYRANWYHDRLYQLGFTEAAGNFQADNFGRGGFPGDRVQCLVQAGADVGFQNNAQFFTPPDGQTPFCFMYVFTGPNPDRDGSLDQEVVCHELTHGLSNRLLGGGVGISAPQTEGMGEGWSDFIALCLLSEETDDPDGVYAAGAYAAYRLANFPFTDNYYFGIRRYPYTTDTAKNPLTFKDIDPTRASDHFGVPISPLFGASFPAEVHNQGEVWCVTLHEMWASFVIKMGWEAGNELAMQLVVDGLKLAPANATFLEARDAIIQADLIDTGGDNYAEIWIAFAKRGMGYSAIAPPSDTTLGVLESFDLPPDLGAPDGILEVKITPPSLEAMFAGETNVILVRVADAFPVTNATVVATTSLGTNLVFRNDGVAPDQSANNGVYSAALKIPTNGSSITVTMVTSAPGKDTTTNVITYFIIPLPPNDNFANATKVPLNGTNYLTSNKRATIETNEPVHAAITSETGSLWWDYTPTFNTNMLVDTGGGNTRTVVAVYTNNTLATLQPVASSAGSSVRPGAFVKFPVLAGRTYRIAVAGFDSHNLGTLSVNIVPGGQPDTNAPNVTIASPLNGQLVTTNRQLITGSAVDPSPNAAGIRDITFRVVPIATLAEPVTTVISSLNGPLNTNWAGIVGLLPGLNSVQVSATDFAGNRSTPATIQLTYRVLDPVNDFFVNAIALTNNADTNSVNNLNATKEAGEPNHAGFEGGKSVWWSFVAPVEGALTLSTSNSTFDTVMAIYTGPNVSHLTNVGSNDDAYDGAAGGFSQIVQAVRSNQTYRIAVDGYASGGGVVFLTHSFVPTRVYRLSVTNTAGGTVAPGSMDVVSNATVVLSAIPNANYQFDLWDGGAFSISNPLSIPIRNDTTITAHFRPTDFTDPFETGNFLHLNWTSAGNKPWTVQTNVVAVGQFAARSGAITHNQTSSLILSNSFRSGSGSFSYRVSSEPNFDVLRFLVDDIIVQQWSGDVNWASFAFPLTAGAHKLEWRYSKDATLSAGLDAAFIDNLNVPIVVGTSGASAANLRLKNQTDGGFFIDLTGQANQQYIVQTSTNLTSWQNISTNIAVSGVLHIPIPPGPGTRFYRAVAAP